MQHTDNELTKSTSFEEVVSNVCSKSELNSLDYHQCNVSLGLSLAYHTDHDLEEGSKFCIAIADEEGKESCLFGLIGEIIDSERYKGSPLTREQREIFQPIWIKSDSKEWIIDFRSQAMISDVDYKEQIKLLKFSFDKAVPITMFVPNEILPEKFVTVVNGLVPSELYVNDEQFEGYTVIQIIPDDYGWVLISGT